MPEARRALEAVAAAILEGSPVNWDAAETTSPGPERELIPYLRLVSRIAEAHREEATLAPGRRSDRVQPATWGHLRVLERLGAGAFGEVYRAWDTRLDREVALKLLADRGDERSPVVEEAKLLARVRHPNVVAVYGAERAEGRVGLWMEFVRGRRLDETLRDHGPFGAQEAAVIGLAVCRALSAVHRAGLLHRDVKAQNVMREDGGRLVLMDFGAGLLLSADAQAPERRLAGTPLYLAPELFRGAPASVQTDIYAAGVLLFHLVTRSFPVGGTTLEDLRRAHAEGSKRFLRDERPDLPGEFVAAVEKALAGDPAARFASAGAMEDALGRAVDAAKGPAQALPAVGWRTLAALAAVAAVAIGLAVRRDDRGSSAGTPPRAAAAALVTRATVTVREVELPPALLFGRPSADGRLLSFSEVDGNLAVLETATGEVRRVTRAEEDSEEHALFSAISADGRMVAYTWWALDGSYEMRVIGTDGRRPRVLVRRDDVDVPRPLEWSRDGRAILTMLTGPDGRHRLALVSADDGAVAPVIELSADVRNASLSPDGAAIVFDAPAGSGDGPRDLFVVPAEGGEAVPLIVHPATEASAVWTPDGRRILFASDRSGAVDLWSVGMAGGGAVGEPELVHRGLGRMWVLGLTDSGTYYYQSVTGAVEVHAAEFAGGRVGNTAAVGKRYSGSNISSAWSPDGRAVAYASRRGLSGFDRRSTTLVIRGPDGEERELVPALNSFLVRSWSPDGRRVLVGGADYDGRSGAYAVDVETGAVSPLVQAARSSQQTDLGRAEWTPDGTHVLYSDQQKRALILRAIAGGRETVALDWRKEEIARTTAGLLGRGYRFSPDGGTLAFSAVVRDDDGAHDVLRVRPGAGASRELLRVKAPERLVFQDWMPDGRSLLFTRRTGDGEPIELWAIGIDGGAPRPTGLAAAHLRDVSVSADGARLTYTTGMPLLNVWALENALPGSAR